MVNEVSDGAPISSAGSSREDDRPTEIRIRGHLDEDPDEWTQSLRAVAPRAEIEPNPWAWIEARSEDSDLVDIAGHHVTAVLVTLDAERWLPETLAGLAALEYRPARLIAIDNESTDATRRLLRRALDQEVLDALYEGDRRFGFGEAVAEALRRDRGHPTAAQPDQLVAEGTGDAEEIGETEASDETGDAEET